MKGGVLKAYSLKSFKETGLDFNFKNTDKKTVIPACPESSCDAQRQTVKI